MKYLGIQFDSLFECSVYQQLRLLEMQKRIRILEFQPKVYLTDAAILLKPDFKCLNIENDETYYVEAKGFETPVWNLKKRLWRRYGPGRLEVWFTNKKVEHVIVG